jgi:hypothetical protein
MAKKIPLDRLREISKQRSLRTNHLQKDCESNTDQPDEDTSVVPSF